MNNKSAIVSLPSVSMVLLLIFLCSTVKATPLETVFTYSADRTEYEEAIQLEETMEVAYWQAFMSKLVMPMDRVERFYLKQPVNKQNFRTKPSLSTAIWIAPFLLSQKVYAGKDIPLEITLELKEPLLTQLILTDQIAETAASEVTSAAKEKAVGFIKWKPSYDDEVRFKPSEQIPIAWTAKEVKKLDIHYRLINESNWVEIATQVSASDLGFAMFYAPNLVSDSLIIRLQASENPSLKSLSQPIWVLDREQALLTGQLPLEFELYQNYPNPFNPLTTIGYTLAESSVVTIEVYNSIGQQIEILVNQTQSSGYYEVNWNGANQTTGIYIYKFTAKSAGSSFVQMKKMTLVK